MKPGRSFASSIHRDAGVRRASRAGILLVGLLAGILAGCGRGQTPIPAGAQEVHISVAGPELQLDPFAVRAGDVYVVLDTPGSSVGFIQRQTTAEGTPEPLTDADLARIARGGDTQGFSMSSFQAGGCSAAQDLEDLGRMGPCGNVQVVVLGPGKYAFYTGSLEAGPPDSIAVLEVLR